ncbi:LSU ribosomal protein L4p (L1e) [Alloactinosynnema sp. L-07]|uniref:sunset domain-containing protein n=1 Tax=Alloactinosynnema sp. L-07 TaxID=1653480 RepID=UPI00065F07A6|nr:hypothetical protein [Alloactinosynnema sp. L-07]CRK60114.1 LSU ribosomal protein L4p (L1e) [Alloactinosynnema sp. L-07]
MPFFGQVWLWSLAGFLVGALLCWILIANPARKRIVDLQSRLAAARRREAAVEADRRAYNEPEDDFDRPVGRDYQPVPALVPGFADDEPADLRTHSPAPERDFFGDADRADRDDRDDHRDFFADAHRDDQRDDREEHGDFFADAQRDDQRAERDDREDERHEDAFDQAEFAAEHARLDHPETFDRDEEQLADTPAEEPRHMGSLDGRLLGAEPALTPAETTQYIPAARVGEPADEPTGDWFADPAPDEHLVDDLADADDPVLDRPADGGTIFTQHTTPIPAELIRQLDAGDRGSADDALVDDLATEADEEPAQYEPEPVAEATQYLRHEPEPVAEAAQFDREEPEPADATLFVRTEPVAEATQFVRVPPVAEPEPEVPAAAFGVDSVKEPTVAYAQPSSALPKRIPAKPGGRFPFGIQTTTPAQPEPMPAASVETPAVTQADRERSLFEPVRSAEEAESAASLPPPRARRSRTALKQAPTGIDPFVPPGPFGPGSALPLPGGSSPSSEYTIKASVTALRYCAPESPRFDRTIAEVWFRSVAEAERVGFRPLA